MAIKITKKILGKLLSEHNVTAKEVTECFYNRDRSALKDLREKHQTSPPTLWIISETNHCRELKLLFLVNEDGDVILKSAYEPEPEAIDIYKRYSSYL